MIVSDEQAAKSLQAVADNALTLSAAQGMYEGLKEQKDVIRSENILKTEGAVEIRKAVAMSSNEYKDYLRQLDVARLTFLEEKNKMEFHKLRIEVWRTDCSNRRGLK